MNNHAFLATLKKKIYRTGSFKLSSGNKSNFYFDKYAFETEPSILKEITKRIARLIPKKTKTVAVNELGGVALGAAVSLEKNLPFIIIRKERKSHGTKKIIEGNCKNIKSVVLVEDIITTGKSLKAAEKILKARKIKIKSAVAVIFRGDQKTEAELKNKFKLKYLFSAGQIINA
jgi:orotate phosphoribosyltransferase